VRLGVALLYQTGLRDLCADFIYRAEQTWNLIGCGLNTGIDFSEESATDINLLELQMRHPYEVRTQKFTKPTEARIGADWEWWLGSEGYWLGLRAQAKKIDSQNLRYPYLDHRSRHGRQIELLISNSLAGNPPTIPIYILYNYWDSGRFDPPWLCPTYPKIPQMLGCGLCEAVAIKSIVDRGRNELKDIAQMMYPWSCLICCAGFSGDDSRLPYRAFSFLTGAYEKYAREANFVPYKKEKYVSEKAPKYVFKVLEGVKLSKEEWKGIKAGRITVIYQKLK